MRSISFIFMTIFGAAVAVTACGGGKPVKVTPPHLEAGTEQIIEGSTSYKKGCYKQAFEHFFRSHELYTASNQMEGVAMSLNNLGTVYRATGDPESALACFDKTIEIYRDLGSEAGEMQALCNKAAVLVDLGWLDQAEAILDDVAKRPGGSSFLPLLNNRGVLLTKKKAYADAEKVLTEALKAAGPDSSSLATVNSALGNLMIETKRYKDAVAFFEAALRADREEGFYRGMADNLRGIGRAYLEIGERAKAVKYWEQSAKIYAVLGLGTEAGRTMADIKAAVPGTGIDIRITELFVKRWLEGKLYEKPCED